MREKTCIICKKQFLPNWGIQKCCSKQCSKQRSKQCSIINNTGRKKKVNLKRAIFHRFIDKYCKYDKNSVMRYQFLYSCLQQYIKKFDEVPLEKMSFSFYLNQRKGVAVLSGRGRLRAKIMGIKLNKRGIKRFGLLDLTNLGIKNKNISSNQACILLSCNPGREKLQNIYDNLEDGVKERIIYYRVIMNYKEIERILHEKNKYRPWKIKIALALYLGSNLSQIECGKMTGCADVSIRALIRLIYGKKYKILKKAED